MEVTPKKGRKGARNTPIPVYHLGLSVFSLGLATTRNVHAAGKVVAGVVWVSRPDRQTDGHPCSHFRSGQQSLGPFFPQQCGRCFVLFIFPPFLLFLSPGFLLVRRLHQSFVLDWTCPIWHPCSPNALWNYSLRCRVGLVFFSGCLGAVGRFLSGSHTTLPTWVDRAGCVGVRFSAPTGGSTGPTYYVLYTTSYALWELRAFHVLCLAHCTLLNYLPTYLPEIDRYRRAISCHIQQPTVGAEAALPFFLSQALTFCCIRDPSRGGRVEFALHAISASSSCHVTPTQMPKEKPSLTAARASASPNSCQHFILAGALRTQISRTT
ncbi:hypothetical protein LY76DRAFT_291851 [Colletotrichum caudatum]|nr:hypothetical protein LY76DRAFT_291851 [Colletotrichum caudatum]